MLSPQQFLDWVNFISLEPFGFNVDEARFGMLGSLIAGTAGVKLDPSDFTVRPPPVVTEEVSLVEKVKRMFGYKPPTSTNGERL